jgi:hypothetical protein
VNTSKLTKRVVGTSKQRGYEKGPDPDQWEGWTLNSLLRGTLVFHHFQEHEKDGLVQKPLNFFSQKAEPGNVTNNVADTSQEI